MPVVGFLGATSSEMFADRLRGFRQGLKETGHAEGENVAFVSAGLIAITIVCLSWQPNWFADKWP